MDMRFWLEQAEAEMVALDSVLSLPPLPGLACGLYYC